MGPEDQTKIWVYGKVEPGWYVASWIWDAKLAKHWEEMGYRVVRSEKRPVDAD